MRFSMTRQENCDLSIQVTAWAGLTICTSSSEMKVFTDEKKKKRKPPTQY